MAPSKPKSPAKPSRTTKAAAKKVPARKSSAKKRPAKTDPAKGNPERNARAKTTRDPNRALYAAVLDNDAKAVARAFAAGADPNFVADRAAAAWAVERGKLPIVEAFIAAGLDVSLDVDDGWSLLMLAATERVARALLAAGADVTHQSPGRASEKSDTVLTLAAKIHPAEVVAVLLEHGADPNRARADGCTPLIEAGARLDVVKLLLDAGAVDVPGYEGRSALDIAIECQNDRLVGLLNPS